MTKKAELTIYNQIGESKVKEFIITEEQMVMDDDLVWKFQFFIDTLRAMLRAGMIESFEIYDQPWNLQRVVRVTKK